MSPYKDNVPICRFLLTVAYQRNKIRLIYAPLYQLNGLEPVYYQ